MNMGRAALMAKRLSLLNRDNAGSLRLYQAAESLFRSQEHGYRAMALFRRAGGQLPASSGVCGSLALAQGSVQHALSDLAHESAPPASMVERAKRWRETADDWTTVVASMITDYQCP
jgi:Tfp pilus assembly protein PilX